SIDRDLIMLLPRVRNKNRGHKIRVMVESLTKHKFQLLGGHLVLEFVNTVDNRGAPDQKELIPDYWSLLGFLEQTKSLTAEEALRLAEHAGLAHKRADWVINEAHFLRDSLYAVFAANIEGRTTDPGHLVLVSKFWRDGAEHRVLFNGPERSFQW